MKGNLELIEDWSDFKKWLDKKTLEQIDEIKPCLSPEHNPPSMMVYSPGKYRYTCPACGEQTVFTVPFIGWTIPSKD